MSDRRTRQIVAAGVLVVDGARVLGFERSDKPGVSLPCGHVDEGETVAAAAVREAEEETGLVLSLDEAPPFVGFDTVGNKLVHTFRARVVGGELRARTPEEGRPRWASVREIVEGPYWHYNRRALRHFGIAVPRSGRFRGALALEAASRAAAERAVALVGGTASVLEDGAGGATLVLTLTHVDETGRDGLAEQADVEADLRARARQLRDAGLHVTRIALRYDATYMRSRAGDAEAACRDGLYTEVHVETVVAGPAHDAVLRIARAAGWQPAAPAAVPGGSRVVQHLVRRFDGAVALTDVDAAVDAVVPALVAVATIAELRYEVTVLETADLTGDGSHDPRPR